MTPAPTAPDVVPDADLGWFVYAVVDADAELPSGLVGLDDQPVAVLAHGRVAAVVGPFRLERPAGRAAELRAFQAVVDGLSRGLDAVLPVRFGSVLLTRESVVAELLAPQEAWFADLLDRVRGRVQLTVQASYDQAAVLREVVEAEPEIARLREFTRDLPEEAGHAERVRLGELVAAAVDVRRRADSAQLLEDVLPLAEAHVLRPVSGLERVLDVALLVDEAARDELEQRLEVLAEEVHPRIAMRLLGPMAVYDFAEGAG